MDIKFGDENGPLSLGILGIVVLAVLCATFCIAKLWGIRNLWIVALLLSSVYPISVVFKYKPHWWKGLKLIIFLSGIIFLVCVGTNHTIVSMAAKYDSKFLPPYQREMSATITDSNVSRDSYYRFIRDWFPNP